METLAAASQQWPYGTTGHVFCRASRQLVNLLADNSVGYLFSMTLGTEAGWTRDGGWIQGDWRTAFLHTKRSLPTPKTQAGTRDDAEYGCWGNACQHGMLIRGWTCPLWDELVKRYKYA